MFPLYDSSPRTRFPIINYLIIALNIYVFYLQLTASSFERFTTQYAFIPGEFTFYNPESYLYILSSIFLHGGLFHIASNLWFLHIFGDNVEDRLGHLQYLLFYLGGGIVATLAQYAVDPGNMIPVVGASGAISAVSGAYFVLFRHSKIKSLVVLGIFLTTANLPVWFFLGYWFVLQLVSGVGSFDVMSSTEGGVAFFAHIGGFVFGWLAAHLLPQNKPANDII
ncbi:MAG: rhomboid family intramembrane serine protease [Weeksellaceae bacterium]